MPGWSRIPSTTSRPPLTRLTTPGGRPSPSSTSKAICCVSGTCSEGLSTNVLPQRDRERQEPERHHRREVERHDRRAHADRLADRLGVDVARDVLEDAALHRRRDRARGLDHLDHARRPRRGASIDRLAHLGRHRAREVLLARHRGPRAARRACARAPMTLTARHAGSAARAARTAASRSADDDSGTRASTSPVAGLVTSSASVPEAGVHCAGDVVVEQAGGGGGGGAHGAASIRGRGRWRWPRRGWGRP